MTLYFDTETRPIDRVSGDLAPEMVCFQYAFDEAPPEVLHGVYDADGILAVWEKAFREGHKLVAHFGAFDYAVLAAWDDSLLPHFFKALAQDRVGRDTLLREQLTDIREKGTPLAGKGVYSLGTIAQRRCGLKLSKGQDSWRLRYAELMDKPIETWPRPAVHYAEEDVASCRAVYKHQAKQYESPDEWLQVASAFVLQLAAVYGVRTNAAKLKPLVAQLTAEKEGLLLSLIRQGLWNAEKESVDETALKKLIEGGCKKAGIECPRTEKGNIKTDKESIFKLADQLPDLKDFVEYEYVGKILSTYCVPMLAGCNAPLVSSPNALVGTGRTSWQGPNLQNFPRREGIRDCIEPRPGHLWLSVDYDSLELRTLAQCLLWIVGESGLAKGYQSDPDWDPHAAFACSPQLLNVSYEDGVQLKKAGDKRFKKYRQMSKCFHPDVEFLTRSGWKKYDDLSPREEIVQATPHRVGVSPTLSYAIPTDLFEKTADNLVRLHNENIDITVTADHRMLAFTGSGNPTVCEPRQLDMRRGWWSAGILREGDRSVEESVLRLAVATQADGSYQGQQIRFGFSKDRKIVRLRKLLQVLGAEYHSDTYTPKNTRHRPVTRFYLSGEIAKKVRDLLNADKTLPEWWVRLTPENRDVVLDEIKYWDATQPTDKNFIYFSTQKQNTDVVQRIAILSGYKANLIKSDSGPTRNECYKLSVKGRDYTRSGNLSLEALPGTHRVVCLSVPSSFVLVRQNGKVSITGQCANFGLPGGSSARTFRVFAEKTYGVILTEQEAKDLRDKWYETFPEMYKYFEYINYLINNGLPYKQFVSQRLRGSLFYTNAANTGFQGLAADGAKRALVRVSNACYCDSTSPLYGCRLVVFIHDELCLEVPEGLGHEAALEVVRIMEEEMQLLTPDIPIRATPALSRCWSKAAEPKYRDGRLVPHEDV